MFDLKQKPLLSTNFDKSLLFEFLTFNLISDKCFLAGGALRVLHNQNEQIKDFDLFFTDIMEIEVVHQRLAKLGAHLVWQLGQDLYHYEYKPPQYSTYKFQIQLITDKVFCDVGAILDSFDLTACMQATDGVTLYYNSQAPFDIQNKELHIHQVNYPVDTLKHIQRYIQYGYNNDFVYQEFMGQVTGKEFIQMSKANYQQGMFVGTTEDF